MNNILNFIHIKESKNQTVRNYHFLPIGLKYQKIDNNIYTYVAFIWNQGFIYALEFRIWGIFERFFSAHTM